MQTFIGYSPVSTGIVPKVPGISLSGTFPLFSVSSQKHPLSLWKTQTSNILRRSSEIHAWVANKVSNLGQWEKVALFPSSDFIAKNQLARECSQSVSLVTIPALTTILDRQFKEDRTLCPVRALRYYLDRTKDLWGSWSLLFISFKKGHTSDIRPTTLSSWLKQTILLCYKQADQQALDLVQVKAHDIKARQQYVSGTSSSSTTSPWPFPSAFLSSGRKEGGGGGGGTPAATKSSGVFPRV